MSPHFVPLVREQLYLADPAEDPNPEELDRALPRVNHWPGERQGSQRKVQDQQLFLSLFSGLGHEARMVSRQGELSTQGVSGSETSRVRQRTKIVSVCDQRGSGPKNIANNATEASRPRSMPQRTRWRPHLSVHAEPVGAAEERVVVRLDAEQRRELDELEVGPRVVRGLRRRALEPDALHTARRLRACSRDT